MEDLKHTKGKAEVHKHTPRTFRVGTDLPKREHFACFYADDSSSNSCTTKEAEANAILFKEAINVASETGMRPREMQVYTNRAKAVFDTIETADKRIAELEKQSNDRLEALGNLIKVTANYKVGINKDPLIKVENKTFKLAEKALSGEESRNQKLEEEIAMLKGIINKSIENNKLNKRR